MSLFGEARGIFDSLLGSESKKKVFAHPNFKTHLKMIDLFEYTVKPELTTTSE
jgi:hypothetical protein